jgi:hypothetical protein
MASLSKTTKDHEEIRKWAEERGGKPAHVKKTGSAEDIGILRIDFPGYSGEGTLEPITWEEFFDKFDERNLALLYQEETAGGERSNFNKFVSSETAEKAGSGGGGSRKRAAKTAKQATKKSAAKSSAKKAASKSPARKKAPAKKAPAKKATKKAAAKRRR